MNRAPYLLCCALLIACAADDDDDPDAADTSSGAAESSDGSSSGGVDIAALYECTEMVAEARPLAGPGYSPSMGLVDPQDTYVVSSTQILPRADQQDHFFELVGQVTADLDHRDGMVAYALGFEPTCGFARTISVWRDEASMMAFAAGDVHSSVAAQALDVGVTGRVTHFTVSATDMPITWEMAAAKVAEIAPFY